MWQFVYTVNDRYLKLFWIWWSQLSGGFCSVQSLKHVEYLVFTTQWWRLLHSILKTGHLRHYFKSLIFSLSFHEWILCKKIWACYLWLRESEFPSAVSFYPRLIRCRINALENFNDFFRDDLQTTGGISFPVHRAKAFKCPNSSRVIY